MLKNKKESKVLSIFVLTLSFMQLNEYFLWLYDPSKKLCEEQKEIPKNKYSPRWIASFFIIITLFFQIFLTFFACLFFKIKTNKFIWLLTSLFFILTIFIIYLIITDEITNIVGEVDTQNSCRMTWGPFVSVYKYNNGLFISWLISYFLSFVTIILAIGYPYFIPTLMVISAVIAVCYSYYFSNNEPTDNAWVTVFGSLWCFLVIAIIISCGIFDIIDYKLHLRFLLNNLKNCC